MFSRFKCNLGSDFAKLLLVASRETNIEFFCKSNLETPRGVINSNKVKSKSCNLAVKVVV